MKKIKLVLMAIILNLATIGSVSAITFSDLHVFGDSLSDSGQFGLRTTNQIDPADPTSEKAQ